MIYRAFEEYLENRYVTAEDVLEVLAGKLEESELIKNSEVLVDGFTGFTPVQIGVLGKLFRLCAKVYVTIIMDAVSYTHLDVYKRQRLSLPPFRWQKS